MKLSEIEGLRVRLAQHDAEAALAALPRLLQEREMLLGGLKEAAHTMGVEMFPAYGGRLASLYGVEVANQRSEIIAATLTRIKASIEAAES